jgi:hypothetical protein
MIGFPAAAAGCPGADVAAGSEACCSVGWAGAAVQAANSTSNTTMSSGITFFMTLLLV